MRKHVSPKIPFVEAHNKGVKQKPTAIVLTLSKTTSDKGAALGLANRLHQWNAPIDSYHYIIDSAETYQCVFDNVSTYCTPYRAIDVLLCSDPLIDVRMWDEPIQEQVLSRASEMVADLLLTHKIPVRYLEDDAQARWLKRRRRRRGGLIVRVTGAWPYESFLNKVKAQLILKGE